MEKEEIFDYVMNTPGNTNPAVLRSMLNGIQSGGSDLPPIEAGDAGKVLTVNAGETAAEWASPSGGSNTKYGPYIFKTGKDITVVSTAVRDIDPTIITDAEGKSYYVPDDGKEHVFELRRIGMYGISLSLTGFSLVYDINQELTPIVSYYNNTGSSVTVPSGTTVMEIYSDIPFSEYENA